MLAYIYDIVVRNRLRQDYGDIDALAESIKTYGLLHPIVVSTNGDGTYTLVCGGRRLEACRRLGMSTVKISVTEADHNRKIELEENIQRKDLTEIEKSRDIVELAGIAAEILNEEPEADEPEDEFCADSARNLGGRPQKPDSLRKVAEEIGVPPKTLHEAQQHVKAVDEFPVLEDVPKHTAIKAARELRSLPEPERRELASMPREEQRGVIMNIVESRKSPTEEKVEKAMQEIDRQHGLSDEVFKAVYSAYTLQVTDEKIELYLQHKADRTVDQHLHDIMIAIENLQTLKDELEKRKTIRRVH